MGKRRFPSVDNWMRGMAKREAKRREQEVTLGEKALLEQTIADAALNAVGNHPEEASRVAGDVTERLVSDGWRLVNEEVIAELANYLQGGIHEHLPGYYFSPEDVAEYLKQFFIGPRKEKWSYER